MSISFQLIEIPENEQVTSRQVSLPPFGGTLGRSFECTVQLPDFSRTLSRVHAEVLPHPQGGFQIIDRSANGVFVNRVRLGKGESQRINDGDSVRLGGYLLLVSDMDGLFSGGAAADNAPVNDPEPAAAASFNLDSVLDEGNEIAQMAMEAPTEDSYEAASPFTPDNVLGEDVYGYDPFEDDNDWSMQRTEQEAEDIVMLSPLDKESQPMIGNKLAMPGHGQLEELGSSIERLRALAEQQQAAIASSVDRERLLACIEATVEKFLDDLSPEHLEEEFNDYLTGWGKDRKYWTLYKKRFNRKRERREFSRQFSALLFEELRDK